MNSDQVSSFVRTLFKIVGTALAAHGATKAAGWFNAEDVIGLVITAVGVYMSHREHKVEPVTTNPLKTPLQ